MCSQSHDCTSCSASFRDVHSSSRTRVRRLRKSDSAQDFRPHVAGGVFSESQLFGLSQRLNLARWVKKSEWTVKKQIDSCPSRAIPLHSVLCQGWNSYWIRHVAEGKPTCRPLMIPFLLPESNFKKLA